MRKCYLPQLLHITAWSDCLSVLSCAVWARFLKKTQAGANGKMRNATSILPDFAINYFWRFSGGWVILCQRPAAEAGDGGRWDSSGDPLTFGFG